MNTQKPALSVDYEAEWPSPFTPIDSPTDASFLDLPRNSQPNGVTATEGEGWPIHPWSTLSVMHSKHCNPDS